MIIEIYRPVLEKCGSVKEAMRRGLYTAWTPDKIKGSFNYGKGTVKDLKKYMDNNKTLLCFVEVQE